MNTVLESLYVSRELHSSLFNRVCSKYNLTLTELLVLLFLANNSEYDTAKDIVDKMKITKSHVSVSVKNLEKRGYLVGNYEGHNRKTIHLKLCDSAESIISEARNAQTQFISILQQGFSQDELKNLKIYLQKITNNVNAYLKSSVCVKSRRYK